MPKIKPDKTLTGLKVGQDNYTKAKKAAKDATGTAAAQTAAKLDYIIAILERGNN